MPKKTEKKVTKTTKAATAKVEKKAKVEVTFRCGSCAGTFTEKQLDSRRPHVCVVCRNASVEKVIENEE